MVIVLAIMEDPKSLWGKALVAHILMHCSCPLLNIILLTLNQVV